VVGVVGVVGGEGLTAPAKVWPMSVRPCTSRSNLRPPSRRSGWC